MVLELLRAGRGVESWVPTGDVACLRLDCDEVLVAVDWDHDEITRRHRHRIVAIPQRRVLQLLLSMPRGVSIPLSLLRAGDQRMVRALPEGVVEIDGSDVSASLKPALSLLSVGVVASTWKQGLRGSSPFAAHCARYVVLDGYRKNLDTGLATIEARYYGVGLAVHRGGCLDWLVSPAPFQADRFTAASWLMAERVTKELAACAGCRSPSADIRERAGGS